MSRTTFPRRSVGNGKYCYSGPNCKKHPMGLKHDSMDFSKGVFLTNREKTFQNNLAASQMYKMLLTSEEETALAGYCSQDYSEINYFLNNPDEKKPAHVKKSLRLLDSALSKHPPVDKPRQLFRASKLQLNQNGYKGFNSHEDVDAYMAEHFPVGKEIEFKGYASTTETPHCLVDFCYQGYDNSSERTKARYSRDEYIKFAGGTNIVTGEQYDEGLSNVLYEFKSKNGVPLTDFGQTYAKKEQEVLLPRGSKFKVVGVHTNQLFEFDNELPTYTKQEKRLVTVIQLEEIE
jgi:hypothetical protein